MLYLLIDSEREDPVRLSKPMQTELTQSLAYYTNYLKEEIYAETNMERKQQLRERLFVVTKLYFIFEQDSIRVRVNMEFYRNWKRKSEKILASKLKFG